MDHLDWTDLARLTASSSHFASSALQVLPLGDQAIFALHAGTALEHLAKALLVRHSPALIAAGDYDSLLHATGHPSAARRPSMRTIGASEAVARAGRFVPQLLNLKDDLELLCDARNGVAHLGHAGQARQLLVPFLKASELLRVAIDFDRAHYWGEFLGLVEEALKTSSDEASLRTQTALGAARVEFERRYGELDDKTRHAILGAIEVGYAPTSSEEQIIDCPACGSPALVTGAVETRYEQDDEDSYSFLAEFFPGYLRCRVCDLELDGDEEIMAANIATSWAIDVNEADFHEPDWDEDYFR